MRVLVASHIMYLILEEVKVELAYIWKSHRQLAVLSVDWDGVDCCVGWGSEYIYVQPCSIVLGSHSGWACVYTCSKHVFVYIWPMTSEEYLAVPGPTEVWRTSCQLSPTYLIVVRMGLNVNFPSNCIRPRCSYVAKFNPFLTTVTKKRVIVAKGILYLKADSSIMIILY